MLNKKLKGTHRIFTDPFSTSINHCRIVLTPYIFLSEVCSNRCTLLCAAAIKIIILQRKLLTMQLYCLYMLLSKNFKDLQKSLYNIVSYFCLVCLYTCKFQDF